MTSSQQPAPSTLSDATATVPEPLDIPSVNSRLAAELGVPESKVAAAVDLLDGGATVPFIARYRKEATGGLDDSQLRLLAERLVYLRELDERRDAVLASIAEQGKLTDRLRSQLTEAETKARVEDIYLPYKPKRRTKAQIAREAGLEPLADALLADPSLDPEATAAGYLRPEADGDIPAVPDTAAALDGARQILVERAAEDAELVGEIRERFWRDGMMRTAPRTPEVAAGAAAQKYRDYFDYTEPLAKMPSHRVLAVLRGEKEEVLTVTLDGGEDESYQALIAAALGVNLGAEAPATAWLTATVRWAWRTKLMITAAIEARMRLRAGAEADAVTVFARNLKDLLLAAPAGTRTTLGLDPGLRTGVKVAVVDGTGKVLDTATVFPHEPKRQWDQSKAALTELITRHHVALVAVGNGTASRETDALAAEIIADLTAAGAAAPARAMVSEAGASVYSASEYASRELPDLDVSLRGAVSIARRLQDPLAELVKIDPKSIGVGQYQHDVTPATLARALDDVVEDAVNAVGVDLNTASVPLLARVSGVTASLAEAIVGHRDSHGPFTDRRRLLDVPRLGPKAFEQCAGFLRIPGGDDPLDASGVHPEAYPVVRRILDRAGVTLTEIIGDERTLRSLRPADFADERFGVPTVTDILAELEKPGRDPRPAFTTATFAAGVEKVADLKPGMVLEGVVTNVAAFGAFVDVGVHQDGLVHVSAMADRFVSDPHEIVHSGQVVKVKVVEVDVERQRIGLSLRLDDEARGAGGKGGRGGNSAKGGHRGQGGRDSGRSGAEQRGGRRGGGQQQSGGRGRGGDRRRDNRPAPDGAMAQALRDAGFGKG